MDTYTKEDLEKAILEVYKKLKSKKTPVEIPEAYILGGQPGSGKSSLTIMIEKKMENNIISINGDDYRAYHPNYLSLVKYYGNNFVDHTAEFSGKVTEGLIEKLGNEKYHLIVEGTLKTAEVPLNTCQLLKEKGYRTNLNVMCVRPELSYLGTMIRYEKMKEKGLIARATSKENHDKVVKVLAENVNRIHREKKFDNIEIFNRTGESLYSFEKKSSKNPKEIFENEFSRELAKDEKQYLIEEFVKIKNSESKREVQEFLMNIKTTIV